MSTPTWRGRLGLMGLLMVALLGAATPAQATGGPAVPVKIVAPQPYQPGFSIMSGFMDVNGTIFFAAQDDTHGEELWKSDGTTAGTVLVKDVQPGAGSSSPSQLTSFNGKLLFSADDGSHGQELWMSDGTAAGTLLVKDILIGVASAITSTPTIVVSGGRAFFVADDGSHGRQLWVSDGTPVGTQLLKTINIPTPGPFGYWPTNLTNVSGTLFFTTSDQGSSSDTLWKSDGTTAGTVAVKVLPPGFLESSMVQHLTAVGQKLFFIVWVDLWVSDGTSAGTIKLMDRIGDSAFTSTAFDGAFIWTANPNQIGTSDGSVTGTVILKQFATGTTVTALLSTVGKTIFFDTHDSAGTNLWTSDGTATGTVLVTTFAGTIDYPFSDEGISIAGRLVFSTCGYAAGCQLWRSDGSATGTVPLTSAIIGELDHFLATPHGGFFRACRSTYSNDRCSLMKTDGTPAGTVVLKAGRSTTPPVIQSAQRIGGRIFFTDGATGTELWVSDGTSVGTTQLLKEPTGTRIESLTPGGSALAGTVLVTDLWPGSVGSMPAHLTTVGNRLFFSASDPDLGNELWVSDGTAVGTQMVADINPGIEGSLPTNLTNSNGKMFFSASNGVHGNELWVSDDAGTRMVQDINPGTDNANPTTIIATDPNLFFSANDGVNGPALWTMPLTSQPYQPTTVAARTYIQAENYDLGGEGVAYHTSDTVNRGGTYRHTEGVGLTTGNIDGSSGIILGWTKPGEWLNYTVDIARTRAYTLEVALAAPGVGGSFHVTLDGADVSGPVAVPDTGSWNTWTTISGPALHLPSGRHTLRLVFDSANPTGYVANIDYFVLDGSTNSLNLPLVRR